MFAVPQCIYKVLQNSGGAAAITAGKIMNMSYPLCNSGSYMT